MGKKKIGIWAVLVIALAVAGYLLLPKFMCIGCEQQCRKHKETIKQLKDSAILISNSIEEKANISESELKSLVSEKFDAWGEPLLFKEINLKTKQYLLYSKGWNKLDDGNKKDDISLERKGETFEMYCIHCEENNLGCR